MLLYLSRLVTKRTKRHVRPAKTQISLGIRPVWSESSLSAWRKLGSLATHWAHSEDSDQTGRMPRLIWVFAGRTCQFVGFITRRLISLHTHCTCILFIHIPDWEHLVVMVTFDFIWFLAHPGTAVPAAHLVIRTIVVKVTLMFSTWTGGGLEVIRHYWTHVTRHWNDQNDFLEGPWAWVFNHEGEAPLYFPQGETLSYYDSQHALEKVSIFNDNKGSEKALLGKISNR